MAAVPHASRPQWRSLAEDEWAFDLSGWVVLRGLLHADAAAACRAAALEQPTDLLEQPPIAALATHAGLRDAIAQLLGVSTPLLGHAASSEPIEFRLDSPPELLAPTDACLPATLDRGERRRLEYDTDSRPDVANVRGLRVLWILEPTSDVALVAASHKTHDGFRPPSLLRMEEMGATSRPALAAGDVVLCAATTLVGRLRTSDSAAAAVVQMTLADANLCAPALGYVERPAAQVPSYFHELSEAQQRVLGPREGMPGGPVATDGKDVFAVPADSDAQEPASTLLEEELYMWHTQGYVVARAVMDEDWLRDCNAVIDQCGDRVEQRSGFEELWQEPDCSPNITGDGLYYSRQINGLEGLPPGLCEPWRRMIAHPAVVQRLNAFIGPGWSDTHGGQLSLNAAGAGGQPVHGGRFYSRAGSYSRSVAGQMESNQVNYAWQLRDVPAGAGGFCEPHFIPTFSHHFQQTKN